MIIAYSDSSMRSRLQRLLQVADLEVEWKGSPSDFQDALRLAHVGVVGSRSLGEHEVDWLRVALTGLAFRPSCVVVTPLTIESVQRRRSRETCPFQVVWEEEVEARLPPVVMDLRGRRGSPLGSAVERMVEDCRPRPAVRKALEIICGMPEGTLCRPAELDSRRSVDGPVQDHPPPTSVKRLAGLVFLTASPLRRYWKLDLPLRCGPKQLLKWSLLLWAIRRRLEGDSWYLISTEAGVRRRTVRRYASELAGCGIVKAVRDPDSIRARFAAWWTDQMGG